MPVAAIYDIHGNLPALEAVLDELHRVGVDHVVVGGDVLPGPMPGETLAALLDLRVPTHFIQGNGECDILSALDGATLNAVPEQAREIIRWTGTVLSPEHVKTMGGWPETVRLDVPGLGDVLFCHATPRSDRELFTAVTPEESLRPIFEPAAASVVVCGHTHMQFDRMIGTVRVVNAGSVGMPFGDPGAYWLLLGPEVELRCTPYDRTVAGERIRASRYPQADAFVDQNIMHPPSAAAMRERFEKAARR